MCRPEIENMMTPDLQNLLNIFVAGKAIWTLCGGALLCILVDSLWPEKGSLTSYGVAVITLITALVMAFNQWLTTELAPLQNWLIMDKLTLFFFIMVLLIALITLLSALGYLQLHQNLTGEFSALVLFSVIGMVFLFASDHLLLNFIGLETMSLAVYVLVGSHKKNIKSNEAAMKYFILGSVASAILLYGIALFYGSFGTLRLGELSTMVAAPGLAYLPKIALALLLTGLFFKMAIVPFHFWAPDVYQGAPAPVTGFMATGVKAAAFGLALRVFMQLNVLHLPQMQMLLTCLVVATLLVGNIAAIAQDDIKRLLAYSSISHAGFLLFGILAGFSNGQYDTATSDVVIFYLFGYLFTTLGAFAVLSLMTREKNEATTLSDLRGLAASHPVLAGAFALFMLSSLGLPGTVGFTAKYGVVALAVQNGHIGLAVTAVIFSVVGAFYYLRPIGVMFFKNDNPTSAVNTIPLTLHVAITFCAVAVLYLGLKPSIYLTLAQIATSAWR